jgi:hypothetical protein
MGNVNRVHNLHSGQAEPDKPQITRQVDDEDREDLKKALEEIRNKLIHQHPVVFQAMNTQSCLSDDCIDEVLNHAPYIFTLDYILTNLSIYHPCHSLLILQAIQEIFEDLHVHVEINELLEENVDFFMTHFTPETSFPMDRYSDSDSEDTDDL